MGKCVSQGVGVGVKNKRNKKGKKMCFPFGTTTSKILIIGISVAWRTKDQRKNKYKW